MCGPTCLKYLKLALFRESLPTPGRLGCDFCFAIAQLSSDHFVVMLPAVPLLPHFFPETGKLNTLHSGFSLLSNRIMLLEGLGLVSSGDKCRDVQR